MTACVRESAERVNKSLSQKSMFENKARGAARRAMQRAISTERRPERPRRQSGKTASGRSGRCGCGGGPAERCVRERWRRRAAARTRGHGSLRSVACVGQSVSPVRLALRPGEAGWPCAESPGDHPKRSLSCIPLIHVVDGMKLSARSEPTNEARRRALNAASSQRAKV